MARINTGSSAAAQSRARSKSTASKTKRSSDALSLLAEDHKRVQKLFKQFDKTDREDADAMRELVEEACTELEMHAALEEELFYPALRDAVDEEHMEMLDEAQVEHDSAKQLIAQLRDLQAGDAMYAATFKVLSEYVMHHVGEEEGEIFKQAKKADIDLEALGEQLQARRSEMQGMLSGEQAGEANEDSGGEEPVEAPEEIPVKDMDIEDEQDMEPAQPASRGRR